MTTTTVSGKPRSSLFTFLLRLIRMNRYTGVSVSVLYGQNLLIRPWERRNILTFVVSQNSKHGIYRIFQIHWKYFIKIIKKNSQNTVLVPTQILIEYTITITVCRALFIKSPFRVHSLLVKLSCDSRFYAFTACSFVFKEITLVGANQGNFFENATACSNARWKRLSQRSLRHTRENIKLISD